MRHYTPVACCYDMRIYKIHLKLGSVPRLPGNEHQGMVVALLVFGLVALLDCSEGAWRHGAGVWLKPLALMDA